MLSVKTHRPRRSRHLPQQAGPKHLLRRAIKPAKLVLSVYRPAPPVKSGLIQIIQPTPLRNKNIIVPDPPRKIIRICTKHKVPKISLKFATGKGIRTAVAPWVEPTCIDIYIYKLVSRWGGPWGRDYVKKGAILPRCICNQMI